MFTGIIRHMGRISAVATKPDGSMTLEIEAPFAADLKEGDSVSVNGACLTVLSHTDTTWTCYLMAETIQKTTLGNLHAGDTVNLELPAQAGDRLDGHIVQGHIDGVCAITHIENRGDDKIYTLTPPFALLQFITPKGSIALDGVSLTVVDVVNNTFTVSLMPYTLSHTTLGEKAVGDSVHVETDKMRQPIWHTGTAVRGEGRGAELGFPTANVTLDAYSPLPEEGIYACRAFLNDDPTLYAAALHVGPRPTFTDSPASVELHILNFPSRELYGTTVRFTCVQKIRDVAKFDSVEDLQKAITEDVQKASEILRA